ncbi:ammonium transporter [Sphingobacterium spiritivorum]|uniref:Ammonium transporter n=1 Tax=Sphingobacterium spiritivorum ATCC 33861 TaxID=525373 RepID=D7VM45_SPHSI|nr:ammonium transporter [Sphingobacterium spiritivorum]EFK58050.1 ammonium transporter [Sphingobacterium spiritivorum ATCC 33861]QQT34689.1 ammonium transporter [Sphingobacterium spiritivorum]WQD35573.1 ammonium transporter [Sphingobacterium spiritivorum]SUJ00914.1 Ammonia transporter [Sphingobacterium spiritivorum]
MKSKKSVFPLIFMVGVLILALIFPSVPVSGGDFEYSGSDTAWMLTSTALVLIMTPGLAYFYGGMVKKKNVISTMLQSFICMAVVAVIWVVFGFSLVFGTSIGGIIGDPRTYFMFEHVIGGKPWPGAPTIPFTLFAMYQLKFAIITPALITGAVAERIRFTSYILFICLFFIFIYAPLAHATWHPDGVLFKLGVLDFAGGTVVHMSAGLTALAAAIYLKQGKDFHAHNPARITYVMLGTGMLWFGWFGFNAGSAFGANALAATALATTSAASGAAALMWIFFDAARGIKPSAMGTCIGAVVGLVAITPAAGFVTVPHSLIIGAVAALISRMVVDWRTKSRVDDTLDVFPCHGLGGMVGMLLTGIFATKAINGAVEHDGLFFGETTLFVAHVIGLVGATLFTLILAFVLLKLTDLISPLRVSEEEEEIGLDLSQHNEKL